MLDDFKFSGAEIASGGEPIYMSVGGTIYGGNTANTPTAPNSSYADQGGIFGGAISSSMGNATNGHPPQIGRNSIYMPGYNDFDMRVSPNIPIHESIYMQVSAEAFNLLNHTIITGVNGTYTAFLAPGASTYKCQAISVPTGSRQSGCFVPNPSTGLQAFGAPSSTSSSTLYGSRNMQFSAKLFF